MMEPNANLDVDEAIVVVVKVKFKKTICERYPGSSLSKNNFTLARSTKSIMK